MREQQRRVNQKIAYARHTVDEAQADRDNPVVQRDGFVEAAVFHLVGAYRAFIAEIVTDRHSRRGGDVDTTSAVAAARAWPDYLPPALAELVALERAGQWPADLLAAWQWCCRTDEPLPPAAGRQSAGVIALVADDAPSAADCRQWLDALQALIERLREQMVEW